MSEHYDNETGEIIHSLYRRSATLGELFAALAKAQAKIEGAEKAGTNPHFNRTYATLGAVIEASRTPLAENGLAVVQMPGNIDGNVAVTTILGHSSGEWIESVLYVAPGKFDAQGVGSVITYLRRYAWASTVGVAPEDDDGEAAVAKPAARPAPARAGSRAAPAAPPTSSATGDPQEPARVAYRRLQYAIDEAGAHSPEALRMIYDGALDEWGHAFGKDAKTVADTSADGIKTLKDRAAYWLTKKQAEAAVAT